MIVFHRADTTKNYTVVKNTILLDNRLSWKAKGLFTYVLSRPETWEISIQDIINRATEGRDSVYGAIRELKNSGYLLKEQGSSKSGKYNKVVYHVLQEPVTEKPYTVKPDTVKPTQVNTNKVNTKI